MYYVKDDGEHIPLYDEQVIEDEGFALDHDMYPTIPNTERTNNSQNKYAIRIGDLLAKKGITIKPGDNNKLVLVFDGNIGDKNSIGLDNYNIGATGLSATYVKKSLIKQTGQLEEYVSGDDGTYQKGVPNYFIRNPLSDPDNKNSSPAVDTVLDMVTGMMWQDQPETETILKPWILSAASLSRNYGDVSGDTAFTYCENLSLAGYDDWRLPDMHEILSLYQSKSLSGGITQRIDSSFKYINTFRGMWSMDSNTSTEISPDNYELDTSFMGEKSEYAMLVMPEGKIASNQKARTRNVRCVRTFGG